MTADPKAPPRDPSTIPGSEPAGPLAPGRELAPDRDPADPGRRDPDAEPVQAPTEDEESAEAGDERAPTDAPEPTPESKPEGSGEDEAAG